ncbi:isoprenoid synthase domain-containing protein [Emericellopsis atlantica]|uniref:Terpene synthase n=1 Tax=Emericellopsis atlantica TaxID=2614577 RepID=A0A9P7ZHX3_9HYPO|nr:isoprenoid synthase domain-containing protein [Emericellopsis atlantica]KAG9252051.1 isoprenoid synthase domain-containing protein [Emericellopsis atlantica]
MSATSVQLAGNAATAAHFDSLLHLVNHKDEAVNEARHAQKERDRLVRLMRGARVRIPDLQATMSHWAQGVNPEIARLELDSQKALAEILHRPEDSGRLKKMNRSGVALFGASWWAYAPYEALLIATLLSIWLFVWDDESDSVEFSDLINDFERSCAFRRETMAYIEASMQKNRTVDLSSISTNSVVTNFRPVGEAIATHCNDRQVKTFLDELRFFITMSEEEQMYQMTPNLPTVEEYSNRRMGSSAVRVCLAITEYAFGITLPDQVMNDEDMEKIWNETNIIISTTNDILSIKKEVAQDQVDTLIPLLADRLGSPQASIDRSSQIVEESVERLDAASERLLARYAHDEKTQADLGKFIEGCQYACTANLNWSMVSGRYRLNLTTMKGGVWVTL